MKVSRPNAKDPTPEEAKELEFLKARIELAVANGRISKIDLETIKQEALASSKGSADQLYRILDLYRTLVVQKIEAGELENEWY